MVKIVCWNINRSLDACEELRQMDGVDVALLQEVGKRAAGRIAGVSGEGTSWNWDRSSIWPAVVPLSDRVKLDVFTPVTPWGDVTRDSMAVNATKAAASMVAPAWEDGKRGTMAVSDPCTLAAARVTPLHKGKPAAEPFLVFSMYARWGKPHPLAERSPSRRGDRAINIYSDGSAHRIISDLSAFIAHTNPLSHRLLAAGDLNTIHGATNDSRLEIPARAETIFSRMQALGLKFMGPEWPYADRQADPLPEGLPKNTKNVPTYLTGGQRRRMRDKDIVSGNQLDYVFASRGFHERVRVHAMNDAAGFGPSDHCRIRIDVQ